MTKSKKNNQLSRSIFLAIGAMFCVYFLLLVVESVFFEERFGLNAKIAGTDVSLKSKQEAIDQVSSAWLKYKKTQVSLENVSYPVTDLISEINLEKSITRALEKQQSKYLTLDAFYGSDYETEIVINNQKLSQILSQEYDELAIAPENAQIELGSDPRVILNHDGQRLLLAESRESVMLDLGNFESNISLVTKPLKADLSAEEANSLIDQAKNITADPIDLTSERGDFEITSTQLKNWLEISRKTPQTIILVESLIPNDTRSYNFFNKTEIENWLAGLAGRINQSPANAQLSFQNSQVIVTKKAVTGYELDREDLLSRIENIDLINRNVQMKVVVTEPEVREDNLETLGLKELVSTGWTNFIGSPTNRIHNVTNGASKFNGVLIKPGENFSFNKALGPVEASTGYLPELVILQDKTVPQYGGGLCQVSSTAFRAALNAGFPILERTMHAYPVSYYKPYGVDATIYLPKPDLVFTNNSGHYILIQTRIIGMKLYFDFYGTKSSQTVKFAGDQNGAGAVALVENVNPNISEAGARGKGSFTARFYRFIYDGANTLIRTDTFTSKYDSPSKYPH